MVSRCRGRCYAPADDLRPRWLCGSSSPRRRPDDLADCRGDDLPPDDLARPPPALPTTPAADDLAPMIAARRQGPAR